MIKTFCDRCKTHIPISDEQNTLTLIGGGDIRINNYCSACYPKVLADLVPVLEGRNQ